MALEMLTILPEKGAIIRALFNPERYTVNKAVQYAEIPIPGLDSPVLQFIRGQNEKITVELFFDTTEDGMLDDVTDVRTETQKIYHLTKIDRDNHAPLRCWLSWGRRQLFSVGSSLDPRCVVESVNEEFTLFSPGGIPLRAKLTVTFREYKTIEEQIQENPKQSSDRTKVRTLRRGETLSLLASQEYQDPGAWRLLAEANDVADPLKILPGTQLRVPRGRGI